MPAPEKTINIAVPEKTHRLLKRIARANGWTNQHALRLAISCLAEKRVTPERPAGVS